MQSDPCKVCGSTDINLIDGFYYCVECGTQDANVRETLVQDMALADGTFGIRIKTKLTKFVQEKHTMSPEWHKWHGYNYILAGMADEVVSLGAGPNYKSKVLWLWTMYVKRFQKKGELGLTVNDNQDEEIVDVSAVNQIKHSKRRKNRRAYNVAEPSIDLFFTILYLALLFDKSDIQLTHLIRFVQEDRLSYANCTKFLPKDIDVCLIEGFKYFCKHSDPTIKYICLYAMTFLKTFNLGPPLVPDLIKIVDRLVRELCLPDDFKHLVYSLMGMVPCDYLHLDTLTLKSLVRIPFYECVAMSYVLVALKMCFGLDDEYEVKLSDVVDKINDENCHMKSHKLGSFSMSSDRLFSFREWCNFLQLRKMVLCKYYWPMAEARFIDADDCVYAEQRDIPERKVPSLTDDITMNILNKIHSDHNVEVIPKSAFPPSLTPWTTYTEVILEYCKDPELRLLLSEDFTQYSLKYACENLELRFDDNSDNIIVGVNESKKCVKPKICGNLLYKNHDISMVFIKNCENKHWLETKPPTVDHIKKISKGDSDKENDLGYESPADIFEVVNSEPDPDDIKETAINGIEKLECVMVEDYQENIFDDDFHNLEEYDEKKPHCDFKTEPLDIDIANEESGIQNTDPPDIDIGNEESGIQNTEVLDSKDENFDDTQPHNDNIEYFYNPETFDRAKAIKELILKACETYHIPVPKEYKPAKEPRKRKPKSTEETGPSEPKKKRAKRADSKVLVNNLLTAYYDNLSHDVFTNATEQIWSFVEGLNGTAEEGENQIDGIFEDNPMHDATQVEDQHATEDPSIIEIANETIEPEEEESSRNDPRFDEKVYDVKQLYLKIHEESYEDDVSNIDDDPEIDKILAKKIEECANLGGNEMGSKKEKKVEEDDDWDDHIPLQVFKKEKEATLKRQQDKISLETQNRLIGDTKEINKFNYWIKHYYIECLKSADLSERFTAEIRENFPRSFSFVIQECAAILDCTPYLLYKAMMDVERVLLTKCYEGLK